MLTSDLVRAQVRKGVLHPRWIETTGARAEALTHDAAELVARFREHVGRTVGELEEAIADLAALRPDVILIRGLAKLLWDRTETGVLPIVDRDGNALTATAIREVAFRLAGASWPVRPGGGLGFAAREALIAAAADQLGVAPEAVEKGLYADLSDAQGVLSCELPTPAELLAGYNLALAQACLLRAREVRVVLHGLEPKRARALFSELKFRRLLFTATASDDTLALTLDGPLSIFRQTSRYGLQLALLLPTLTRCARWSLAADIAWNKGAAAGGTVKLELDQDSPLGAAGRDRGTWTSAEEEHFATAFAALGSDWKLEPAARVIDLDGRDVLVPDYALVHRDGREALLELVFAWRRKTFEKRLELLGAHGPPHLIVALADRGGVDDESLPEGLAAYRFKGVIAPKRIIALAEELARKPAGTSAAPARRKRKTS